MTFLNFQTYFLFQLCNYDTQISAGFEYKIDKIGHIKFHSKRFNPDRYKKGGRFDSRPAVV